MSVTVFGVVCFNLIRKSSLLEVISRGLGSVLPSPQLLAQCLFPGVFLPAVVETVLLTKAYQHAIQYFLERQTSKLIRDALNSKRI